MNKKQRQFNLLLLLALEIERPCPALCGKDAMRPGRWPELRCDHSAARHSAGAAESFACLWLAKRQGACCAGRQSRSATLSTNAWERCLPLFGRCRCGRSAEHRLGAFQTSTGSRRGGARRSFHHGRQGRSATLSTIKVVVHLFYKARSTSNTQHPLFGGCERDCVIPFISPLNLCHNPKSC
jgi:hypothetical protein